MNSLFLLNDRKVTGKSGWDVIDTTEELNGEEKIYRVCLKGISAVNENIELEITYALYSNLPIVRKKIDFKNIGPGEQKIESLDVESLNVAWGKYAQRMFIRIMADTNISDLLLEAGTIHW